MWKLLLAALGVMLASGLFVIGGELLAYSLYRRLFGILYRNVSVEYAEPMSFWVTMALCVGLPGYLIISLVLH
jgi:hypothetical protein